MKYQMDKGTFWCLNFNFSDLKVTVTYFLFSPLNYAILGKIVKQTDSLDKYLQVPIKVFTCSISYKIAVKK